MSDAKGISTAYDVENCPDADDFDPIAWWQGTGEDLGLPTWYTKTILDTRLTPEDEVARAEYWKRHTSG